MTKKNVSFEQSMARLEEIIKLLEEGDAPLEDALSLFEEGAALIGRCSSLLDRAEQTVLRLTKGPEGEPIETPLEMEHDMQE